MTESNDKIGAMRKCIWEIKLEQEMNFEQQIDQAVASLKTIMCQSARSLQDAQRISDRLDAIGYHLKSNNSALSGNFSKSALEAVISKMYADKSRL